MSAPNETYEVELKESMWSYVQRMKDEHGIPDESKVLRCLVSFARSRPDLEDEIFAEIRCQDC